MGSTGAIAALGTTRAISTVANSFAESESIKAEGIYQEGIHNVNAAFAKIQAADSIERGEKLAKEVSRISRRKVTAMRRAGRQVRGSQRVSFAAQGIEVDSGSAADIQAETQTIEDFNAEDIRRAAALDALTIRNNAWRESFGFKFQASQFSKRGRLVSRASRNRARSTLIAGVNEGASRGLQTFARFRRNSPSSFVLPRSGQ